MTHDLYYYLAWGLLSLVFGSLLAYGVHWLLVLGDHRDYLRCGGHRGLLEFRRERERIKRGYRAERELAALHRPCHPVPPTLGEFVLLCEQGEAVGGMSQS